MFKLLQLLSILLLTTVHLSGQKKISSSATVKLNSGLTQNLVLDALDLSHFLYPNQKLSINNKDQDIFIQDIKELELDDTRRFELVAYKNTARSQNNADLTYCKFAEILVDGEVRLSKVMLDISEYDNTATGSKNYLYILTKDNTSTQLDVLNTQIVEGIRFVMERNLKGKLKYLFSECTKVDRLLNGLKFTDASMSKFVVACIKCQSSNGEEQENITVSHNIRESSAFSSFGLIYNSSFNEEYTNAHGLGLYYQLSFLNRKKNRKIGLSIKPSFTYFNYDWAVGRQEYGQVNSFLFRTSASIDLHVVRIKDFQIILSAGTGAMFVFGDRVVPQQHLSHLIFPFGLQVQIKDRWTVQTFYIYDTNALPPTQIFEIGLGYVFNRKIRE